MLTIGMLWFDNNKNLPLTERILRAARYYHIKYKKIPNSCHINPSIFDIPEIKELKSPTIHYNNGCIITLEPNKSITLGCMWTGVDPQSKNKDPNCFDDSKDFLDKKDE